MYQMEISHKGLNRYRIVKGSTPSEVENKARMQLQTWEDLWRRKLEAEDRKRRRESEAASKEQQAQLALDLTKEAEDAIAAAQGILAAALNQPLFVWEQLKDRAPFLKPKPVEPGAPTWSERPDQSRIPPKPKADEPRFQPSFGALDSLIPGRKRKVIEEADSRYQQALKDWKDAVQRFNAHVEQFNRTLEVIKERCQRDKASYLQELKKWQSDLSSFEARQKDQHKAIEEKMSAYERHDPEGVREFCEKVLIDSEYPAFCPQAFDCEYQPEAATLIVEYRLPAIDDIPAIKAAKYDRTNRKIVYTSLSQAALSKLFDDINYQIALRTLHELFSSDYANVLASIVFNGYAETIDKATGRNIKPCIMSVQVSRDEFEPIKLDQVDPKTCFKRLKGVSAAKLQSMAAVAPVAQISRDDRRFVEAYDVAASLDDSMNLASMDWEDFEHLIRELFAKEFESGGGEVKVTQASRDGGVDAVAFDPDPIRGGKIVIQAKRYTNVVGVSAVRDLYGTVMNEGAIKGILVTTSHYGADAYEFAKGKPLTLLDGGHLLHLLAKHGHRARINIGEAKKAAALRNNKV
jgi:restriction system protein